MAWQVQTAKQRFSELVARAVTEGPQVITKHGRPTAVVIEIGEYRRLRGEPTDFVDFLLSIPKGDDLEIVRSKDPGRVVEL
jgi:antitoxin Phd